MGVDIQTYRGRIGCFSRNLGTDVITVQYIVDFTRGLKTIGTVVFIGILLLLAGIEQNPGPISESISKRTPANATILKVCGLPTSIGTDSLISIFENTRRQGGGNVLRVDIDKNDSSALVEFEEAEALQLVLRKRPIQIDGKDVSVEIYIDEGSMDENNSSQTDGSDEVFADKPSDQQLGSDSEDVNMSGAVAKMVSTLQRSVTEGFRKGVGFIKSSAIFGLQENIVAIETESAEQLQEEEEPSQTKEDTGSLNIEPAVRVSEGAVPLQPTEHTATLGIDSAEGILEGAVALQPKENTVALETESAKQLLEAADSLLSTEDTVAQAIKSAARIPERAEPLQPTEETALKMECAETNQEEAEPLKTPEKNVALEGESAEQLLEEEEPLQTSEDTGSVNIESAVRVSEGSVPLQPSENTEAVETEYAEQLLEEVELLLTTEDTVAQDIENAARIPERAEPLQSSEEAVLNIECAETNQEEAEPFKTPEYIVALETKSTEQLLEEEKPLRTSEDTGSLNIESAVKVLEGAVPLQPTEDTGTLGIESAEGILEGAVALQPKEDTVAVETESVEQLHEEAEPILPTGTVAQDIESAARIPEGTEPLQQTVATALKMECTETNQEEEEPLKTPEIIVALETESPEQLLKEDESLQSTEDIGSIDIESDAKVAERGVLLQPTENAVDLETESEGKMLKVAECLQTKEPTGALEKGPAVRISEVSVPLQTTEDNVGLKIEFDVRIPERRESLQLSESTAGNNAESNPYESDLKNPDSSKSKAETEGQVFYQILQKLGLTDNFPGKISMRDVIAVDPNESIEQVNGKKSLTDIPWLVLRRLICAHGECRDITMSEEEITDHCLNVEDSLTFCLEIPEVNQDISPLDIFTVVFQCCDPVLKQIFVQKLYLCKLAVPFLYRYWETNEKQTPILSVWPLRALAIESKQRIVNENNVQGMESDVLDLQTKVFAFGRLGRPRYSKSKLLNSLLLSQGCKTFFNIDCPAGMTPRQLSNGQVEMFWLPTIDGKKDRFQDAMTFLNLRGDLEQDFSKDLLLFISHYIDSIVIIIDLEKVLKHAKMVKDVLLRFSSVILIIANPLNHDAVKQIRCFQSDVKSSKSVLNLQILSTHKGAVEQNVVDMLSSITKIISNTLKTNNSMSFEERLLRAKSATIKTDEEDEDCKTGKRNATELIKHMKTVCEPCSWKQHLTPVHGNFSKQLGKLLKERVRERDIKKGDNIDEQIKTVRRQQIESITKAVRFFLDILIENSSSPLVLRYFLCWLHFFIEREKRKILPRLMHENRSAWEMLKALKGAEKGVKEDIKKQETIITELEERIDEASFAVQYFFREIGHIHEAILELNEDTSKLGFPDLDQTSSVIGRLVADGHPFELIDGESFYMPYRWTTKVLEMVDVCIGSSKVMTLGVLGLQSSGKSTLLNTMFGSQFASRAGRCTRGIHVQLIPAKTDHIDAATSVFSYVLIVDTEGLRSTELSNVQHEHDNELATVITGVGDITMFNIMGENTSEIRDILQVIVHAFLRLKMANEKLDIRKSCAFIHQNVTDTSASENMISGLSKLMQSLDEMTQESAKSEGIHDIQTFNQVIEFDITSQVWYLKNLWQGNPPMARVNNEYSERLVDIKCEILKKALTMKNKSYKSLNDIVEHAHSLWKGVLNEDFVFSFRNSLEIKAYMQMEGFVVAELWRLESVIQDKLIQMSQKRFAACDKKENLQSVADKIINDLRCLLSVERTKTVQIIQRYFEGNKYKDIIIQWENHQQVRVTFLCDKLQQVIKKYVEKCQVKRSLQILTVTCQEKHEEELRKRSIEVANAHKGQKLRIQDIDKLFDDIWKEFLNKVDTSSAISEKHVMKMENIFMTCLENIFNQNHALLNKVLNDTNSLSPLSEAKSLVKSFCETGINEKDVGCTLFQKGKALFRISDIMKHVGDKVNLIFESVDRKIAELCKVDDEVTEMSVDKLMHELHFITQSILTVDNKYTFKATFYVKLYVHVCRYAHPIFENHNENYLQTHGTAILLEQYKVQQKISFNSHLRCREIEELIAELLSNVVESFAEEWTSQSLPNKVADKLQSFLPKVKNRVIIDICTDLLENGSFENFHRYIMDPYGYASSWITKEANRYLDDSKFQVIAITSMSLLDVLFTNIKKCVNEIHKEYEGKPPPSIETWIETFKNTMELADVSIPSESFRNVRHEQSSRIQNVGHLTNTLLEYLNNSEKKLTSKFKLQRSYTIKWASFNPISRIIEKIWGCKEQCVFCGEPCAKDQNHDGSEHYSIQHRPSCCRGTYMISSNLACLESCNCDVNSNTTHTCSVFKYVCNNGKQVDCGKTHYYKDFKTYFPNWDIAPSSIMHESSEYWMWFVATYKDQLKKKHGYLIDNIPPSWSEITKSMAKESLHKVYLAC